MWMRHLLRLCGMLAVLIRYRVLPGRRVKGENLTRAMESLGPAFIKLGQALSTRADLIGSERALALADLRDNLPPFSTRRAKAIIAEDFERPVTELFAEFRDTPVAAASIAQVHKAVTRDGRTVAVKIIRPGIREALERDLALFFWIAKIAERHIPSLRRLKPMEVVRTLQDMVAFETDMRSEAAAATELRQNTRACEGFYVPEIDWNRTSERVLTSEWVQGTPISDVAALKAQGFDPDRLLKTAAVSFFHQVFEDGFFHGDLHPGNVFVNTSGEIVVVDFGIMGRLDRHTRIYLAAMLDGYLRRDYRRVAQVHFDAGYIAKDQSLEQFALALRALNEPILGKPLNEISVARLLAHLFRVTAQFNMETQPQLLLLQKSMMVTEGIGRMLNPGVNMWQLAEPLVIGWGREHLGVKGRARHLAEEGRDLALRLPAIVKSTEALLESIRRDGLRLHPDTLHAYVRQSRRRAWGTGWVAFGFGVVVTLLALTLAGYRL